MNLYILSQYEKNNYDTYDAMVVAAESAEQAILIRPDGESFPVPLERRKYCAWATETENVHCTLIGVAADGVTAGEILSSFNAG